MNDITLRHVCKSYTTQSTDIMIDHAQPPTRTRQVLRDVNVTFPLGKLTVLVGRSGCGKSTLLRLLSGQDQPDSGEIEIPEGWHSAVLSPDPGDMVFIENDAKLLLQRLPEDVKNIHYHDDETHIRQLLEKYDLVPSGGISLAAATVQGLILTVSHKEQIGELYPQVLETLVYGACRELFE